MIVIVMVDQVNSVDEALTSHQWNIHWSRGSGGASGSPQSPDGGSQ